MRLEIEGENIHFFTIFSIKRNLVVVAKPPGLRKGLKRDGTVRFRIPDEVENEIRMEIAVPHFNLLSGDYAFLCDIPKNFAEKSKRKSERYNTSRFNNLHLVIPDILQRFRIVDMSDSGCKIYAVGTNIKELLEEDKNYAPARISVGNKVEIDLDSAIPRSFNGKTVGFKFDVSAEGSARKYLQHFIQSLETAEINNLKVDGAE